MPSLEQCGNNFMKGSNYLQEVELPVKTVGENFFANSGIKKIILPKLEYAKRMILYNAKKLEETYLPSLQETDVMFMCETPIFRC